MGRPPDPSRKPKLTEQIADYLAERGIVDFSLRSLSAHLGCSTYTLVYNFGTREQLLIDVIEHVEASLRENDRARRELGTLGAQLDSFWNWVLEPRNLGRVRLSLEATLLRSRERPIDPTRRAQITLDWIEFESDHPRRLGLPDDVAVDIGTQLNAIIVGLLIDLIATGDIDRLTRTQKRLSGELDERLAAMIDGLAPDESPPTTRGGKA
jgi:AcrR family transcriptional regulator